MQQYEIDEISTAFMEAWQDSFGAQMYYIPFDNSTTKNVYQESKGKKYLWDDAKLFHGTIKEVSSQDTAYPTGKKIEKFFEITFITKELADLGITHIDTNSLIKHTDHYGKEFILHIYDDFQKVQLVDNKIFTKLKVRYNG